MLYVPFLWLMHFIWPWRLCTIMHESIYIAWSYYISQCRMPLSEGPRIVSLPHKNIPGARMRKLWSIFNYIENHAIPPLMVFFTVKRARVYLILLLSSLLTSMLEDGDNAVIPKNLSTSLLGYIWFEYLLELELLASFGALTDCWHVIVKWASYRFGTLGGFLIDGLYTRFISRYILKMVLLRTPHFIDCSYTVDITVNRHTSLVAPRSLYIHTIKYNHYIKIKIMRI